MSTLIAVQLMPTASLKDRRLRLSFSDDIHSEIIFSIGMPTEEVLQILHEWVYDAAQFRHISLTK